MKKKMKKIMALAAALVMCLGILTVPAAASDTTLEFDDYVYTGQIGDTVYLNATYVGEQNPADFTWECSTEGAVAFSGTSTMGPDVTGEENTWWISNAATVKEEGEYTITLTIGSGSEKTVAAETKIVASEATTRYTVLIMDASSSMGGTPAAVQKEVAVKFCESLMSAPGTNYVAIVKLNSSSGVGVDFTTDIDVLKDYISSFPASGSTDTNKALETAGELLDEAGTDASGTVIKNIVLCSDGLPQHGSRTEEGPYTDSDYTSYRYANYAYNTAAGLKEKYTIYTLGFFHDLSGNKLTFAQRFMKDLASQEDYYYEVTDADDLVFVFGEIAQDLLTKDSDGDGLPDEWEINGADTDGDGSVDIPLDQMGADPNVPDVFVEIDWMVRPESKFLIFTTQEEYSYAPGEDALRIVYEAFREQGINLHLDAGPDSVDFVTGNTWGSLSGGNEIAYEENFVLGTNAEHWNDVTVANFSASRESIFHHCIFLNEYDGSDSTGVGFTPGQYFIIAKGHTGDNNTSVAGTFMHELGHNLGLGHGGVDHNGNINGDNYKPNYLSIMNYSFQLSGLVGTGGVDYSRYTLPDLDETNLSESDGIDPEGLTAGAGLGTKINNTEIYNISGSSVDYNNDGITDENLTYDLNMIDAENPGLSTLTGVNDWENIMFSGGNIGKGSYSTVFFRGINASEEELADAADELTYDTALKYGLLGNTGSGEFEILGPYTLAAGENGQSVYIRVINRGPEDAEFTLKIGGSEITSEESVPVTLNGSVGELSYADIPVSVLSGREGTYSFHAVMEYENNTIYEDDITVELTEFGADEISSLKKMLNDDTVDLPDAVRNEYVDLYEKMSDDPISETPESDDSPTSGSADENNGGSGDQLSDSSLSDTSDSEDGSLASSTESDIKTGDENHIILYTAAVIIGLGAVIYFIAAHNRKRKNNL